MNNELSIRAELHSQDAAASQERILMSMSTEDRDLIALALRSRAQDMWRLAADNLPSFAELADRYSQAAREAEALANRVEVDVF